MIRGESGNESKKSEKVTTKSVRIKSLGKSFSFLSFFQTRNFVTFEKALTNEWKPNRRQATTRSAVTTYNLLRGNPSIILSSFFFIFSAAFLTFYERNQRAPALATQAVDIPNLVKILREKANSSTASASNSLDNEEFHDELLE